MSSDIERIENRWMDWPDEGWLASEWNITHIGCAGLAFFLYIIPGIIFVIVKSIARSNYQREYEIVKKNHDYVFEHTGCHWLASATHLGGHPLLPYRGRVVIGIKSDSVRFYDYGLQLLHSVPLNQIQGVADTRHITTSSFGTVYKPQDSSFGTTSSTQHIDMHPDTLRLALLVKGENYVVEFDMRPYDPLDFLDTFNKTRLG